MSKGFCPNCEIEVDVSDSPRVGQKVTCKACHSDSVIVWLNPIELEIIDYDEFDEDFYDAEMDDAQIEDIYPEA
jgi:hypothetical protein